MSGYIVTFRDGDDTWSIAVDGDISLVRHSGPRRIAGSQPPCPITFERIGHTTAMAELKERVS